jgi:hypothetical protein
MLARMLGGRSEYPELIVDIDRRRRTLLLSPGIR